MGYNVIILKQVKIPKVQQTQSFQAFWIQFAGVAQQVEQLTCKKMFRA